jgi:hypothetical protein
VRRRRWWLAGLAIAASIVLLAPLASRDPDGLQRVASDLGFAAAADAAPFEILPGYTLPGLEGAASTVVAGIAGVALVFVLTWLLGVYLSRRRRAGDRGSS